MPPRTSADPEKLAAAVRVVLSGALSQRAACKRYGVPKTTLARAVRAAREQADQGGPDQRAGSGPDRTTPNQTPGDVPERPELRVAPDASDARLPANQMQAAAMLVDGTRTHAEIAALIGVDRKTITRWKQDPVFASVMSDLEHQARQQAMQALARGAEEAVLGNREATLFARSVIGTGLRLLKRLEEEGAESAPDAATVEKVLDKALVAARVLGSASGKLLMDAGGFPKTERVEVNDTTERDAVRSVDKARAARDRLRLVVGGAGG